MTNKNLWEHDLKRQRKIVTQLSVLNYSTDPIQQVVNHHNCSIIIQILSYRSKMAVKLDLCVLEVQQSTNETLQNSSVVGNDSYTRESK